MGQADEASPVFFLNFRRAVVEQPAILQRRVPSQNASLHGDIDPCPIHVLDLRVEIKELGMNVRFGKPSSSTMVLVSVLIPIRRANSTGI